MKIVREAKHVKISVEHLCFLCHTVIVPGPAMRIRWLLPSGAGGLGWFHTDQCCGTMRKILEETSKET